MIDFEVPVRQQEGFSVGRSCSPGVLHVSEAASTALAADDSGGRRRDRSNPAGSVA
jgi:hypothetical protein